LPLAEKSFIYFRKMLIFGKYMAKSKKFHIIRW